MVENELAKALWDLSLVSEGYHPSNRSDLVLFDYKKKAIMFQDHLQLQKDIDSLQSWSIRSNLLFSLTKILFISFKSTITTSYSIGTNIIPKTESHHDLGIIISSNLSWEPHYYHILGKAYKVLGLLQRTISTNFDINCKKQLYILLVQPQLMFSSALWKPHLIKHILLLEHIQRCATKYILNDYTSDYRIGLGDTEKGYHDIYHESDYHHNRYYHDITCKSQKHVILILLSLILLFLFYKLLLNYRQWM